MPKQPFVPVAQCIRIKLQGLYQAHPWVNLFSVKYTGNAPTNAELDTYASAVGTLWSTTFGTFQTSSCLLQNVQVWDLTSQTAAIGSSSITHTGGSVAGTLLPVNCAYVVTWPVQSRWRGGHFRTYCSPRNQGDITGGNGLTTATHDALLAQAVAFRTQLNATAVGTGSAVMSGIRYFPTGTNPDGTPVVRTSGTPFPVLTPVVHLRMDSQRRRLGKELT